MSMECPQCGFIHPPVEGPCPMAKTKADPNFDRQLKVITTMIISNKEYLNMDKFIVDLANLIQKYKLEKKSLENM
ncbi:MAG: hypothetical protein KatS3mg002_0309 [Candidatus Woesearchaeota archaeon]|nr:MAG: hypothetical protein KatS3mg002_0309 [Candidatus Woesearchaeota archaeon]